MFRTSLWILAVVLMASCNKTNEPAAATESKPATTEAGTPQAGLRIGVIYTDSLATRYEYQKGLAKTLEDKAKRLEADMERRGRAFEENIKILQSAAPNLNQEQLQQAQMELAQKEQELMQYRDARAQELMQEQAKLNELIRDDVETVIKEIQEELNLDFIYSVDQASNILYANPAFDITDVAVEKLNRNFRAKQGKNAAPKK
jgi:outer membrane protein